MVLPDDEFANCQAAAALLRRLLATGVATSEGLVLGLPNTMKSIDVILKALGGKVISRESDRTLVAVPDIYKLNGGR